MPRLTAIAIADRIRQLRKDHGFTQEDLAAKSGLGVATIQRAERGEPPSAATVASIAAAFNLTADVLTCVSKASANAPTAGSYLPLSPISSGKQLVDMTADASAIDFDYMDIEDENVAELLGRVYEFCAPRQDREIPTNPAQRIRLDIEASKFLKDLAAHRLTVSGGIYDRTCHEVQDDDGSMPMLLASWEETCLVLRIGTASVVIDRADVMSRMGKWMNTNDPRVLRPAESKSSDDERETDWLQKMPSEVSKSASKP